MIDASQFLPPSEANVVQLVDASGEWFVRVVENGEQTFYKTFDRKRHALIYAEAERRRLGLHEVVRV